MLFVNLFIFFVFQNAFAQKDEKKVAQELCDCVEKSLSNHPTIFRQMLMESAEMGEARANIKFKEKIEKMTAKQKEEFKAKMASLPDVEKGIERNCAELGEYIRNTESLLGKLVDIMKKNKKCKLGYSVAKLFFERSKK